MLSWFVYIGPSQNNLLLSTCFVYYFIDLFSGPISFVYFFFFCLQWVYYGWHYCNWVTSWGKFVRKTILYYSGEKVNYYYNVDKDLVSYFELQGMVKDLGYKIMSKIYYKSHLKTFESGLRLIISDKEIPMMLEACKLTGSIKVYVEHIEDDQLESVGREDSSNS